MSKRGPKVKTKLERKFPVTVYITGERMKEIGGIDKAREIALTVLNGAKNIQYE